MHVPNALADNGGLQAISILLVLKEVCKRLSEKDGHTTPLRPCQLFDVIGGIGTGGWLAILLGRYRLRIDQCMSIYVKIASAIDPTKTKQDNCSSPAVLNQSILIDKIDKIIAEHEIGEYLVEGGSSQDKECLPGECHAFAVGVIKRSNAKAPQGYRLFRTYVQPQGVAHEGPNPAECKVSAACAATAAAKGLLGQWTLDVDGVTYWDDSFPLTHNVSELALDEAASLFGKKRSMNLDFVLNISPGVVSKKDVDELSRQSSHTSSRLRWKDRRFFSSSRLHELTKLEKFVKKRRASYAGPGSVQNQPERSETSSSTSSDASQTEKGHQKAIKERLLAYEATSQRKELYFRLELPAKSEKPYLNDVGKPDLAMQLAQDFLGQGQTQIIMNTMIPQDSITGRPATQSPRSSFVSAQDFAPIDNLTAVEAH